MQTFAVKKSLIETFRRMKKGERIRVKYKDFKVNAAYSAKYRLRKKGIEIKISQAGMIDEWEATRMN